MRNLRSGAALWGAVFLIAALLRLRGIGFGLPAINDPDELMFELGAFRMLSGPTLNPGWFGHPATTTMYLLAVLDVLVFAVSWAAGLVGGIKGFAEAVYHNPAWLILPHRLAMVGFSLGCVALTARLAARIWRAEEGTAQGRGRAEVASIGAAALLAFNPVFITWSQVVRSDVMACLFLLLALLACCDVAERGRRGDWLRSGAWIGVAVATKWPFALDFSGCSAPP